MQCKRCIGDFLILLTILLAVGCMKEVVSTREPVPDMIWPPPPEVPRIRLVNSISSPEDMEVRTKMINRLIRYIKGEKVLSIVSPWGIVKDSHERLYVVDTFYRLVHVFDQKSGDYYTFPERKPRLLSPIDITVDETGRLYLTDSAQKVVLIFSEGGKEFIRAIGEGLLERPTGIAYNPVTREILVVDTKASQVIRYDVDTLRVKGIIGREGMGEGQFYNPVSIGVMSDGRIIVSDSLNFRIQILSPDGKFLRSFGRPGDAPGYFSRPKGIAVDSEDHIYVVDAMFDNVQIFDREGRFLMSFGKPGKDFGEFWLPSDIFIDEMDRIYVSDTYNHRIQVFQYIKESEAIEK